jgi:hypothetical protein
MPVVVNGVREFLKAIDQLDDDMYKNVKAQLKTPMLKVAALTKREFPDNAGVLSGWLKQAPEVAGQKKPFPAYDQGQAQGGIKYKLGPNKKNRSGYSVYNYVSNESAAGAIYETAGRKTTGAQGASLNPNAGVQFIQALPNVVDATLAGSVGRRGRKNKGRVIYKVWAKEQGPIYADLKKALDDAIFAYYKKMPLEQRSQVIGFYKERRARGFRGV